MIGCRKTVAREGERGKRVIVASARNIQALHSEWGSINFVRSARSGRGCEEGRRGASSLEWQWGEDPCEDRGA